VCPIEGATMDTDNDANRAIYGKDLSAQDIVKGSQPVCARGQTAGQPARQNVADP